MKTLGILFTVALMVTCFCLWISRDKAVNESARLLNINSKLDNTIKTQSKAIKTLEECKVSQNATIKATTAENNAKDDKIKQFAVRIVNLETKNSKLRAYLRNKKVYRVVKRKSKKRNKITVKKKSKKSSTQIRKEKEIKILTKKKEENWSKYLSAKKGLKNAKWSISRKNVPKYKKLVSKYLKENKRLYDEIEKLKL